MCCITVFPCWSSVLVVEVDSHPLCFSPEWGLSTSGTWRILQRNFQQSLPSCSFPSPRAGQGAQEGSDFPLVMQQLRLELNPHFSSPHPLPCSLQTFPEVHELSLCVTIVCSLPLMDVVFKGSGNKHF